MSADLRDRVVAEARRWLRTPFHNDAEVLGGGVDCIHLLHAVYSAVGLVQPQAIERYAPDWWMHRDEERILQGLERAGAVRVEEPLPGDAVTYRFGRCFSHAGIVVAWPTIIHAHFPARQVELANGEAGELSTRRARGGARERRFYSVVQS